MEDYGVLEQRVHGLERGQSDLAGQLSSTRTELMAAIAGISDKMALQSRPQWAVLFSGFSVMLTVVGAVGFLTLQPVKDKQADFQSALVQTRADISSLVTDLAKQIVPRTELDGRTRASEIDRSRLDRQLSDIQAVIVPRGEFEQTVRTLQAGDASLQRQIDAVVKDVSGIYTPADALQQIMRRLDDFDRRLSARSTSHDSRP